MATNPDLLPAARRPSARTFAVFCLFLGSTLGLHAGPPFLTDDPEPVDLHHWEFYVFGQGDRTAEADGYSAPDFEFNYGVAPNTQLHLVAPVAHVSTPDSGWASGYGDTEVGVGPARQARHYFRSGRTIRQLRAMHGKPDIVAEQIDDQAGKQQERDQHRDGEQDRKSLQLEVRAANG